MQLILAPLQGVTEFPFRNAWSEYFSGLDEAYSPFIPCVTGNRVKNVHIRDVIPENNRNSLNLIPQLLCNSAGSMLLMAEALASIGYSEINWNMGCPSAVVVKHIRGCGLMPHPDMIRRILDEVMNVLPVKLSVKLRLGMKSADELWPVMKVLNEFPLSRIIIHPRLGVQNYDGTPDLVNFRKAVEISAHPVTYNGDIFTSEKFKSLQLLFPNIDSWMLGRGVLMNPLLPAALKGDYSSKKGDVKDSLYEFNHSLIREMQSAKISEQRVAAKIKEYWFYFSNWFEESSSVWYSVSRSQSLSDVHNAIDSSFAGELNRLIVKP